MPLEALPAADMVLSLAQQSEKGPVCGVRDSGLRLWNVTSCASLGSLLHFSEKLSPRL